uniref:Protein kinase domain-containing protein n=1 Tax=Amphora coffeiformis TaxID=265554 RepID=A0A7S3KW36_9STRA
MGACLSGPPKQLIENSDGGEDAYHKRYMEGEVLGEGEFGQVRLVHDMTQGKDQNTPFASKILKKGMVFKDNTLYSPIKPEVLRGEVEILKKLAGKHYNLKLMSIYETPKVIYMVTEFCGGGEMMEYVGNREEDLRTEDVSRIAFQLLSAVDHCSKCHVIHRDIKPENIMFQDPTPQAEIRLIDFGSGTMDTPIANDEEPKIHTTFAGSAFYISPEMYQRTYTDKTDVWSVGATLYVLVAGYPAEKLQKAFNILQTSTDRKLKSLPNLPEEMPDSFYELLEGLLTYRHKRRPSAGDMIKSEFVQFHREHEEGNLLSLDEVAAVAASTALPSPGASKNGTMRTTSISLKGSVDRHNLFLGFKKYERSLTALLATMLSKKELQTLIEILRTRVTAGGDSMAEAAAIAGAAVAAENGKEFTDDGDINKEQQLSVIKIADLKKIVKDDIGSEQTLGMMEKLPGAQVYGSFAYHVSLLRDFATDGRGEDPDKSTLSVSGRRRLSGRPKRSVQRQLSFTGGGAGRRRLFHDDESSNGSFRSNRSGRGGGSQRGSRQKTTNRSKKGDEQANGSVGSGRMFGPRPKPVSEKMRSSTVF